MAPFKALVNKHYGLVQKPQGRGFSLVELLVTLVISGVVLTAAVGAVVAFWRYSAQVEARNRLQDQWGQINFLISSEIAEAREILDGDCGTDSFTLAIPSQDASDDTDITNVCYGINNASQLIRVGPPFNANGVLLQTATPITSILAENADFPTIALTSDSRIDYTLSLTDITGATYQDQVSASRARARIIDS